MNNAAIAIALLPLLVVLVIVLECSRLRCARAVQRRMTAKTAMEGRTAER